MKTANYFFSVLSFAVASAASAQTVPAEAWVGAPIAEGSVRDRTGVVTESQAHFAAPRAPQQLWVGSADGASDRTGGLSRKEVVADLDAYRRSGLADSANTDAFDPYTPRYQRQAAKYMQIKTAQRQHDGEQIAARAFAQGGATPATK